MPCAAAKAESPVNGNVASVSGAEGEQMEEEEEVEVEVEIPVMVPTGMLPGCQRLHSLSIPCACPLCRIHHSMRLCVWNL
jgi:hypothetical protein